MKVRVVCPRYLKMVSVVFLLLLFGLLGGSLATGSSEIDLPNEAQRQAFLQNIGLSIRPDCHTQRSVAIPWDFNAVYREYNRIQRQAGFDLTDYSGKTVMQHTYKTETGQLVHLLQDGERLIGGDICGVQLDSQMLPLFQKGTKIDSFG